MLTAPVFRPWRSIWDVELGSATLRLDELAAARQRGRTSPPAITPDVVRRVMSEPVQSLIQGRPVIPAQEAFAVLQGLRPLVEAAVWPRWLLLEAALEEASACGDLHVAALALRTQIEELDALQDVARLFTLAPQSAGDSQVVATGIEALRKRVLPRVRTKSAEELLEPAGDAPGAARRSARLQKAFDALGDYVHPNYGSHVLSVRPHSAEAATVLTDAFVAVYEAFLSLPWARDADGTTSSATIDTDRPFEMLAEVTAPALARADGAEVGAATWPDVIACFRRLQQLEDSLNAEAEAVEGDEMSREDLKLDVGTIRALRECGVPADAWPVPIRTAAERLRYAVLVQAEHRLTSDAARLDTTRGKRDDAAWLSLLCSALTFSMNVSEFRLGTLGRQAARLVNAKNVVGAALVIRSMLEHHAVAVELGKKLSTLWQRIERAAPDDERVAAVLDDAERQLARVLAGSPESREQAAAWRSRWQEGAGRYHVLDLVRAMDADQPGYLKTYALLSHIVHGTVCTGGDLLGQGGILPARRQLAQLALFLANLCTPPESMLDRQAGSMLVASRLAVIGRDAADGLGSRVTRMRLLDGQKLKPKRDVRGSGTEKDPFRFRRGLLYHDAYYHWLRQNEVQVCNRRVHTFAHGMGDRVETEDGRVLYFMNEEVTPE